MLKKLGIIASFPAFLLAVRFIPFDRLPCTCGFFLLTGYPCPACGSTRAVMALLRLDFDRAMQMNLCGIASVAIFGLWWAVAIFEIAAGRRTRLHDWAERRFVVLTAVGLGILLAFGALRIALLASR